MSFTPARMNVKDFRDQGYLQEVNRLFLHPLGLALEVIVSDQGEIFGGVWDYQYDSEGCRWNTAIAGGGWK